jgi:hypothetical protein
MRGLRRGAEVEYPDDLGRIGSVNTSTPHVRPTGLQTYNDHGQKNEAGGPGLFRRLWLIYQRVHRKRSENETGGQIPDNLDFR